MEAILRLLVEVLLPILLGYLTSKGWDTAKGFAGLRGSKIPAWIQQILVPVLTTVVAIVANLFPAIDFSSLEIALAVGVAYALKAGQKTPTFSTSLG